MKFSRSISSFSGEHLVIGCGSGHTHFFSLLDKTGTPAETLHPSESHYTVSLDEESSPDLIADFHKDETVSYFEGKRFSTITFEVTTGMLSSPGELSVSLRNAKRLLADGGVLLIFKSDTGLSDTKKQRLSDTFRHGKVYFSGLRELWSAVLSDDPIDLNTLRKASSYLETLLDKLPSETELEFSNEALLAGIGASASRMLKRLTQRNTPPAKASAPRASAAYAPDYEPPTLRATGSSAASSQELNYIARTALASSQTGNYNRTTACSHFTDIASSTPAKNSTSPLLDQSTTKSYGTM